MAASVSSKDKVMEDSQRLFTIDDLQAMFDNSVSKVTEKSKNDLTGILSDWTEKFRTTYKVVDGGQEKTAEVVTKEVPVADMAEANIAKMEIMGLPIGQAAVGGFVAVFATELVDGFLAAQSSYVRGAAKLVAAYAASKWGKKIPFVSSEGAKAVALLVTFDAIRDLIPIDTYAKQLATKLSGTWTSAGLAQGSSYSYAKVSPVTRSADYYSGMLG
jgi:hypothetical protein